MKKLSCLFSFLLVLFLYTCSYDEGLIPDLTADSDLKCASGAVITVKPGNTGNDTQALINAFVWAKGQGPGSMVRLTEGEYHIGPIEVDDFHGSFMGAGKGKTVIIPLSDIICDHYWADNIVPELLKFLRGDVKVAKMTFRYLEGNTCIWDYLGFHDWAFTELPDIEENRHIRAMVDQVEFISNYSPFMAICVSGDFIWADNLPYSKAAITVTNCSFDGFFNALQNLAIDAGDFVFSKNQVTNTFQALWLQNNIGGRTTIANNRFNLVEGGSGIEVDNLVWDLFTHVTSNGCSYEITGNSFYINNSTHTIGINDARKFQGIIDNKNPLLVLVRNNLFDLRGIAQDGIYINASNDAVIRNNKFIGQATRAGLYLDALTDNCLMLGNNFSTMVNTPYHIVLLGNHCTVVGCNYKGENVLDLGTDNVITGAKVVHGYSSVGKSMVDNFNIMKENMMKLRKP